MESTDCTPVKFFDTDKDSFYFEVVQPDTDLEEDDFRRTRHQWCITSQQDGIGHLILNDEDQEGSSDQFENKFKIVSYRSNSLDPREKMPVMIYAIKNDQMMAVCYKNKTIQAEAMASPLDISGLSHMALFYQTKLPGTNRFKFVSSVDRNQVLGVVSVSAGIYKLVLVRDGDDYVDESAVFMMLP